MLPPPDAFAVTVGAMGITRDTPVVVYDTGVDFRPSARVWWTFKVGAWVGWGVAL